MKLIKIHKILKGGLHMICLRVEVPWGARLHLGCIGANSLYMGVPIPDLFLELSCLVNIHLILKRKAKGEEKFTGDPFLFHLVKALLQLLIGIGIPFIHPSHTVRTYIR